MRFRYKFTDDTLTMIDREGEEYVFETVGSDLGYPFQPSSYYLKEDPVAVKRDEISFSRPSVDGVHLSYLSFGNWQASFPRLFTVYLLGLPTAAIPSAGSASYRISAGGQAEIRDNPSDPLPDATYLLRLSEGSFTVNFGTGKISTEISLKGMKYNWPGIIDPLDVRDFGQYIGTGQILSNGPSYAGVFGENEVDGEFSGAFFGPEAVETGYVYLIKGEGVILRGSVAGRKD